MDLNIKGRTALVLGSSQGLGLAVARNLAGEGASVILVGRSGERLEAAAAIVRAQTSEEVRTEVVDFSDSDALDTWLTRITDYRVDILVNNGGGPPPGPVAGVTADVWRKQFDTMVNAPFRVTTAILPGMRDRTWGRIINIVSSGVVQPIAKSWHLEHTPSLDYWLGKNTSCRGCVRRSYRQFRHPGPNPYLSG